MKYAVLCGEKQDCATLIKNIVNYICWLNVFLLYVYVWLPWLRSFRAFSSVVRQMPR
jgi:hypothetical protein